jgi:hypothetical protein
MTVETSPTLTLTLAGYSRFCSDIFIFQQIQVYLRTDIPSILSTSRRNFDNVCIIEIITTN